MFEVLQSETFREWLASLSDRQAIGRINARVRRLSAGNFGDAKFFGALGELRIDYGPGYRVYFTRRGPLVILLLCGGDKRTQAADFKRARAMIQNLKE
jgi:putative addiction module killer protein